MVLMTGMQNRTEVGLNGGANQSSPIHYLGDIFKALRNFYTVHIRVDCRKSTEDLIDFQSLFKREVSFGVKSVGGRHSSGHPNQDTGVRFGFWMDDQIISPRLRSICGQSGGGGQSKLFNEIAPLNLFWNIHIRFILSVIE